MAWSAWDATRLIHGGYKWDEVRQGAQRRDWLALQFSTTQLYHQIESDALMLRIAKYDGCQFFFCALAPIRWEVSLCGGDWWNIHNERVIP